tara:strand:- start:7158 stop:8129 length:972 start_codon:yes stop_codon:yes gene_type:complete
MLKVALLFSGQVRKIPPDLFKEGIDIFTNNIEYDIFAHFWDEAGQSMNHNPYAKNLITNQSALPIVKEQFKDLPLKHKLSEPYKDFEKKIPKKHLEIHLENKNSLYSHSLPQIYSLCRLFYSCKSKLSEYDLILKCRFDSVFTHRLIDSDLVNFNLNNIYNINFGKAYYPKRIYDIFFGGNFEVMKKISTTWDEIPNLVDNEFNNGLYKCDPCRIFYLSAINNGINVSSLNLRTYEVYRYKKPEKYITFLANSGIAKPSWNIIKMLKSWKLFYSWSFRKPKLSKLFLTLLIFLDILRLFGIDCYLIASFLKRFMIKIIKLFKN